MFEKLGFSTNAFTRYSIEEAISRISQFGYEGVELLADTPHLFLETLKPVQTQRVRDALHSTGLVVSNINANTAFGYYEDAPPEPFFEPALSNPSAELRQWRIEYTKKAVDLAVAVSAENISVTSGKCMLGEPPEKAVEVLKRSLVQILDYAQKQDIRVGIEYEPGLLIENAEELLQLIQEMDHPALGANLDIGHAQVGGEDIPAIIECLGDRIFHLHLEDIRGKKHYHRIPGEGDIDFAEVGHALEQIHFSGFVTIELYNHSRQPDTAAQRAMAYLTAFRN